MSEQTRSVRDAHTPSSQGTRGSMPLVASPGPGMRVDPPHLPALSPAEAELPIDQPQGLESGWSATAVEIEHGDHSTRGERSAHLEQLLLEAGQIADHLRQQNSELERREQRINTQLALLDQERRNVRMWAESVEGEVRDREANVARTAAEVAERADTCLNLEQELQELRQTLIREKHNLDQERAHFAHELQEQRAGARAEIESLREEFRQEKSLQENRLRFQNDHLQRSRQEFETAQVETRFELQAARASVEHLRGQLDLRRKQLDHYRELLEERELSVSRERETLVKSRRALDESCRQDQERVRRDQESWEAERNQQRADLRRQHDLLAVHAENLETRRHRLDQLRSELEETNRSILELRVAVEEATAELSQRYGAEATRIRIDEARDLLVEQYQHTRESLHAQRQDLEQALLNAQEQRHELIAERQMLTDWVSQQEELLLQRGAELEELRQTLSTREDRWRESRDRWANEKLEAETVIRNLLRRLSAKEVEFEELGSPSPVD